MFFRTRWWIFGLFYVMLVLQMKNLYGQPAVVFDHLSSQEKDALDEYAAHIRRASNEFHITDSLYRRIIELRTRQGISRSSDRFKKLKKSALIANTEGMRWSQKGIKLFRQVYSRHIRHLEDVQPGRDTLLLQANLQNEEAQLSFYKAKILRNEYDYQINDLEVLSEIRNTIRDIERTGIQKLHAALKYFYQAEPPSKPGNTPASFDHKVVISRSLLNIITKTYSSMDHTNPYFNEAKNLNLNDTVSVYKIRRLLNASQDSVAVNSKALFDQMEQTEQLEYSINADSSYMAVRPDAAQTAIYNSSGDNRRFSLKNTRFRLQIATTNEPCTTDSLQKRYNIEDSIVEAFEKGWYQYSLEGFTSYQGADRFRKQHNIKQAFIFACEKAKPDPPGQVPDNLAEDKDMENTANEKQGKEVEATDHKPSEGLVFKVQFAARKEPLTKAQIRSMYRGSQVVSQNREGSWYRYAIGQCPTYHHAARLKDHIRIKGSWVVAYRDGQSVTNYPRNPPEKTCPSIAIIRNINEKEDLFFSIQITSGRDKLTAGELIRVYCGDQPVLEINAASNYKYAVGIYSTYQEAAKQKKNICVPGAFVIAIKKGQIMNLQAALKQQPQ